MMKSPNTAHETVKSPINATCRAGARTEPQPRERDGKMTDGFLNYLYVIFSAAVHLTCSMSRWRRVV